MWTCVEKCLKERQQFRFPIFSPDATAVWRCLYQWSGQKVTHDLPALRDGVLEVRLLKYHTVPRFLISFANEEKSFPPGLGVDVDEQNRETSDPLELRDLLSYSPNGPLLARELVTCYHPVFPDLHTTSSIALQFQPSEPPN